MGLTRKSMSVELRRGLLLEPCTKFVAVWYVQPFQRWDAQEQFGVDDIEIVVSELEGDEVFQPLEDALLQRIDPIPAEIEDFQGAVRSDESSRFDPGDQIMTQQELLERRRAWR